MALITCRECKTEISDAAKSCPKCGAPAKKKSSGWGLAFLGICGFLVFVVVVNLPKNESTPAPAERERKLMDIGVKALPDMLVLRNNGSPEIIGKAVTIYINGMPPFTFKKEVAGPAIGEVVLIPLSDFIKKDGTRFDPHAAAVVETWVGGAGFDYGKVENKQ